MDQSNSSNKVMNLADAIRKYVQDGSHICFSGFTVTRNPTAAIREIIRQGIKDLHVYTHSYGQGTDELIGAGCVSRVETSYGGYGHHAPTAIRYAKAIKEEKIKFEDYTNFQMVLRFHAGALGVPFLPVRSSFGTDIVEKWGFSKEFRKKDPKIPDEKIIEMDNPFHNWCDTKKVMLVPAINVDVAVMHVQKADREGTCRIIGLTYADIDEAKSARDVIITCEEVVSKEELRKDPGANQLSLLNVSAVVHVPYGAYPTACYQYYDYDSLFINDYVKDAKDDGKFFKYLDKYVYGVKNHDEFLELIGSERLETIKADPILGYAKGLNRK